MGPVQCTNGSPMTPHIFVIWDLDYISSSNRPFEGADGDITPLIAPLRAYIQ